MAATTVMFAYGATSFTLPLPRSPMQITPHVPSGSLQTGDGHYGYQTGDAWYELELVFMRLTAAQMSSLLSFYDTTVLGETREWTYTDPDGGTQSVRFLREPQVEKTANTAYKVTVRLRSESRYS